MSNAVIVIGNVDGIKQIPFNKYWNKKVEDKEGDLIIQLIIKTKYLDLPYAHVKRTKNEKIDYPLISIAALKDRGKIKMGFSGLCDIPFRSYEIEEVVNNSFNFKDIDISTVLDRIPYEILDDNNGSSEYRKFMLEKMLEEIVGKLGSD